ncbi:MAG: DUF1311 domain-containing protein [Helicobacter sp.]|uniref:lysozyme inhibitor LprI family protein n=1 Tax=Helicobacter sp. TaxID=218 RepID=UPI002A90DE4F|nr:DUF1311 domain-containing protein [Helicobacter sp.]MDY5950277.1 DUF1311 domain-containing protein [Helicobacter sp.]
MTKTFFIILTMVFLSQSINAQSPKEAKPSFDCAKATTRVEKMICSDKSGELKKLDRYMAEVYTQLRKELKISKFPDKEQRLKDLLDSQRAFIKNLNENNRPDYMKYAYDEQDAYDMHINFITHIYENRITQLLKLLGEVLDSNNKELCEYARKDQFDENKWQEVPPSVNPPFSIGFCTFGTNSRYGDFTDYCTKKGEIIKEEMAKALKDKYDEKFYYIDSSKMYEKKIDINNDGVPENLILITGGYYDALWIYKNGKLDAKASDKIYGDDLHFHGENTLDDLQAGLDDLAAIAFGAYAMPSNKISQLLKFDLGAPMLSYLSYNVMEFKGKNYITLYNYRFNRGDDDSTYPKTRIYLLEGNKRELKCTY